jgi:23S rRNA (pseudouridine1915-N3)-methyltransferase
MRIRIVAVGGVKQRAARELCDEYLARISRYSACEEVELSSAPPAKLAAAFTRATAESNVVALDERGEALTSPAFAQRLERLASRGKGVVSFLIGGADGLPRATLDRADERWCLSRLTLPHRLARVVLAEQLYRALTILRGEPYDRRS